MRAAITAAVLAALTASCGHVGAGAGRTANDLAAELAERLDTQGVAHADVDTLAAIYGTRPAVCDLEPSRADHPLADPAVAANLRAGNVDPRLTATVLAVYCPR
jgi:hypothetical protein